MSEETASRARPYPAALKDEIADINLKLDSLIKHWADAAEMTSIMEECRATVTEAHKANHQALTTVSQQLNLLLTPVEVEAPNHWRWALWSGVGLLVMLLSFWLGGFAPWVRTEERRLRAFLADVHTTLEQSYSQFPKGVQQHFKDVYRHHKYEEPEAMPQEKRP